MYFTLIIVILVPWNSAAKERTSDPLPSVLGWTQLGVEENPELLCPTQRTPKSMQPSWQWVWRIPSQNFMSSVCKFLRFPGLTHHWSAQYFPDPPALTLWLLGWQAIGLAQGTASAFKGPSFMMWRDSLPKTRNQKTSPCCHRIRITSCSIGRALLGPPSSGTWQRMRR